MTGSSTDPRRQPMATAPRNGLSIILGDEDVGEFVMHWNPAAENPLFAPGRVGLWEAPDLSMTWMDDEELGPSWWRPLA